MIDKAVSSRGLPGDDAMRDLIGRGIEARIITEDQGSRLAALAADTATPELVQDDERLRFITGFADIFVTLGLLLFFGAAYYLLNSRTGGFATDATLAALAWAMAEFFSRRRRMALPSIVLLAIFSASSFGALASALGVEHFPSLYLGITAQRSDLIGIALSAVGTLGLTALHYRRFRVPITVAAGVAVLICAVLALILATVPELEPYVDYLLILAGLSCFVLAMRFDLSDPARLTRASDIAFWLHLLAAPLIVHPVLSGLVADHDGSITQQAAAAILGVVLLLSAVALITDRRAILVSGLAYAGFAVWSLIQEAGERASTIPLTILLLGAFVLLLSAGWHPLRRALLGMLPRGLSSRLPRPVSS